MKLFFIFFFIFTPIFTFGAENVNELENKSFSGNIREIGNINLDNKIQILYDSEVYLGNTYKISTESITQELSTLYPDSQLRYSWDIFSESPQSGENLEIKFQTPGKKQISLNIYATEANGEEILIFNTDFFPLVYEYSIPILYDSKIEKEEIMGYNNIAQSAGILLYPLGQISEQELIDNDVLDGLDNFKNNYSGSSDYIVIWGSREFIFSSLNRFEGRGNTEKKLNFVLISAYNNTILKNYIENSVSGKKVIENGYILNDIAKLQILRNPSQIDSLIQSLDTTSHEYYKIDTNITISPILFISRFIKELSLGGVNTSDIYIILMIPFFLSFVSIAKHIIGVGSMGVTTPVFLSVMFLKLGVIFTLSVILFLFFFNILLGRLLNKYTLLYTPKINFILILNIVFFMLFYIGFQNLDITQIHISNLIYVVLFFLVSERIISVIITKEYREYKKSFWGTIIISLASYLLFFFDSFLVFIFSYPEIILILIPLNFLIGRFTGLRITEYFRFSEIIKQTEE